MVLPLTGTGNDDLHVMQHFLGILLVYIQLLLLNIELQGHNFLPSKKEKGIGTFSNSGVRESKKRVFC